MLIDFRLDAAGVREVLKSEEMHAVINGLAHGIRDNVQAQVPSGVLVTIRPYSTDRGAAAVTIEDVRGMAWQARDGVLTRAAAAVGLEVKAWQR